ncbi:MAG: class I SAM-dependent methyltransferase [Thermoplasmatota archaeon]
MKTKEECPLCGHTAHLFHKNEFYLCSRCKGIFRAKSLHPTRYDEKSRYKKHNNDVNDPGYQNFVSPIIKAVKDKFSSKDLGLDFGAGTGPVISKLLQDDGFNVKQYDPFFHDTPELLDNRYDYIVCCEVIEHFHDPYHEFKRLNDLLSSEGNLFCMTYRYSDDIDFDRWGYKNDPTHTFFYQNETLKWIKDEFKFTSLNIDNRLIEFVY